jgi:alpha-D-xyloside xylohydrolase
MKDYPFPLLNQPLDISRDFHRMENPVFLPLRVKRFDRAKAEGLLLWRRNAYKIRMAFNQESVNLEETGAWEFPDVYGGKEMELPFSVSFLGPRTIRLKFASHNHSKKNEPSLMLVKEPKTLKPWKTLSQKGKTVYQGPFGSVTVEENPCPGPPVV